MTDQVADALTKIEAGLAAVPDRPWTIFGCNMDKHPLSEFGYPQRITNGGAVLIAECYEEPLTPDIAQFIAHAPTYLAALVEVAEAANNGLFECENRESGEPWYKWLRAALDALTKAVQP